MSSLPNSRGTTTALSYTQTLAITMILVSGLLLSFGTYVDHQQNDVAKAELEVVGQQVVRQMVKADTLARASGAGTTFDIRPDVPLEVVGKRYSIEIRQQADPEDYEMDLRTADGSVSVTVTFTSQTTVDPVEISGGNVVISYSGSSIEVQNG